jgi:acyl-lipid omega-6 desaturase (Delta-12 desaturase)
MQILDEREAAPEAPAGDAESGRERASRHSVDRFARPDLRRSLLALATSVVPFLGLWTLMYFSLRISYLLVLALAVPTAGFLLRTYILHHDCAHGSLFPGKRANGYVGAALAVLAFTPFADWRREHAGHHATGSDLDRRGIGDVPTLTVGEYQALSWGGRLGYRLFRNPLVMFGLGPLYAMVLVPRWVSRSAAPRIKRSVWGTNLALALIIGGLCWLIGWRDFLLIEAPLVPIAGGVGIWLFFVQHNFDYSWWRRSADWNYVDAALRGSSYLKLPRILQFFTGNIGLHHVHHLNPKVPNYNLQRAHDETPLFRDVPRVSLWSGVKAVRLKLWDEDAGRMVTWADVRSARVRSRLLVADR